MKARIFSPLVLAFPLALALLLAVTGCETIPTAPAGFTNPTTRRAEYAWLALDVVDTMQTVTIARSPDCLYEADPLARMLYGSAHPSVGRVLGVNAAMAGAHYQLGAWLDRNTERALSDEDNSNAGLWYVGRAAFYGLSFLGSGTAVIGNVQLGIKPLSHVTRCRRSM
jgi:hypothetical protein